MVITNLFESFQLLFGLNLKDGSSSNFANWANLGELIFVKCKFFFLFIEIQHAEIRCWNIVVEVHYWQSYKFKDFPTEELIDFSSWSYFKKIQKFE